MMPWGLCVGGGAIGYSDFVANRERPSKYPLSKHFPLTVVINPKLGQSFTHHFDSPADL